MVAGLECQSKLAAAAAAGAVALKTTKWLPRLDSPRPLLPMILNCKQWFAGPRPPPRGSEHPDFRQHATGIGGSRGAVHMTPTQGHA